MRGGGGIEIEMVKVKSLKCAELTKLLKHTPNIIYKYYSSLPETI